MELKRKTNVTFSVGAALLKEARKKASALDVTLNDIFLEWLEQFARGRNRTAKIEKLFKDLAHINAGRKFARDESYDE